jgi:CHASE2 domain-containing sensor protein
MTVGGAALLMLLVTLLLQGPLASLESGMTSLRYAVRGVRQADTNIVVVYIDDPAIKVTGWPVRHNFHALMLKALTDLHVRAVGIEPVMDDQRDEYPEYDQVLASVMKTSVPVVMTCYFDTLTGSARPLTTDVPSTTFSFPGVTEPQVHGRGLHRPLSPFPEVAAGVGHVNFSGKGSIPVFVAADSGVVPSFATELARVSAGVSRDGIQFDGQTVAMRSRSAQIVHDVPANGSVTLLYPGAINSFATLPFLEVLLEYDRERAGATSSLPVLRLQNKIVLIGPIASGRGFFVDTPVDPRLPSILVHATALDNALGNRFLTVAGPWSTAILALVLALLCGRAPAAVAVGPDRTGSACRSSPCGLRVVVRLRRDHPPRARAPACRTRDHDHCAGCAPSYHGWSDRCASCREKCRPRGVA